MKPVERKNEPSTGAVPPGTPEAPLLEGQAVSATQARHRVLNLLSRHPDLVAGRLGAVAETLCSETSMALPARRVGIWRLAGDELVEEAFSGKRFEDLEPRRLNRSAAPAFFAALERRGVLTGRGIHELETVCQGSAAVGIQVDGSTWGFLGLEGCSRGEGAWSEGELDFALVMAEQVGRCIERGRAVSLAQNLERAEQALSSFARMSGNMLCFEVLEGALEFYGDPRSFIGPAPAGALYGIDRLLTHVRGSDRELVERRYRDWANAGAPGVLTARFQFRIGPDEPGSKEVELECRLLRTRGEQGLRLWGTLRRTDGA